jgi:hypothetical protein
MIKEPIKPKIMKNKLITLPGFCLAVICTTAKGQVSTDGMPLAKHISSLTECVWDGTDPGAHKPGQNIFRNFERKFKNVTNARWYESSYGFVVKFNLTGIDYRVDLDKRGTWLYTIRNYDEMKLPGEIRHLINDSYKDYSITLVQEIETPFNPVIFAVNLDGKTDMIQLRVSGNEMQEWRRFRKTHPGSFTSNNKN